MHFNAFHNIAAKEKKALQKDIHMRPPEFRRKKIFKESFKTNQPTILYI